MKKSTSTVIAVLVSLLVIITLGVPQAQALDVSGQYLVLMKGKGVPASFARDVQGLGGTVVYSHPVGIALVKGLSEQAAATLARARGVADVEPDFVFQIGPVTIGHVESAAAGSVESPDDPTTATRYPRQWDMRAIDAPAAWAEGRLGTPAVTVAIIDSGIDYTYPDLAGLVDLSRSISFVPSDDALVDLYFPGTAYFTDLFFHGTHVASTVASNALILAGVTSQTTLMAVKVCDVEGNCSGGAVIAGVLFAADNGADVANMSLGGYFLKAGSNGLVGFLNTVFNYANSVGMTVVVSAGNDAVDLDHFPNLYNAYCSTPSTICVSATGPTAAESVDGPWTDVDAPAPYTNYGRSAINVAAPGGTSVDGTPWGYVWGACSTTSLVIPVCQTGIYIVGATGTSMAAPHVSGEAALVVDDVGRRPGRVKTVIQQTADDLGQPGTDPYYGKGRINVGNAVNH